MAGSPQGVGDRMIRIGLMVLIPGGVEIEQSPRRVVDLTWNTRTGLLPQVSGEVAVSLPGG